MSKPKTPKQAADAYQAKIDAAARTARRAELGKVDAVRIAGEHERRYQAELEARGQARSEAR